MLHPINLGKIKRITSCCKLMSQKMHVMKWQPHHVYLFSTFRYLKKTRQILVWTGNLPDTAPVHIYHPSQDCTVFHLSLFWRVDSRLCCRLLYILTCIVLRDVLKGEKIKKMFEYYYFVLMFWYKPLQVFHTEYISRSNSMIVTLLGARISQSYTSKIRFVL